MRFLRVSFLLLAATLLCVALSPNAKADVWNEMTYVSFNKPVQIPGQVLEPGTYMFKLANTNSNRNVVQIFNKDGNHLYATVLAISDYKPMPNENPVFTLHVNGKDLPLQLNSWFYAADTSGHAFVYPPRPLTD